MKSTTTPQAGTSGPAAKATTHGMSSGHDAVTRDVLAIDPATVTERITRTLPRMIGRELQRRGVVVGVSGGVDSAVCAALAVRALGAERVHGLLMPEADSDPAATERSHELCDRLGIAYHLEDISPSLTAMGCYRRRDDAIRRLFPDYGPDWRQKVTVAGGMLDRDRVSYFNLTVAPPHGAARTARMPVDVYLEVLAATNMKQRTRKLIEHYHAEARNFAVLGTPNRLEYELGFFVRGGDGLADLKPIAHLYKTQVYAMAEFLGLPREIRDQPPSTDTYSLPQTQEELYFVLPYADMDLVLWGHHHNIPAGTLAPALDLRPDQVDRAYRDVAAKRRTADRLSRPAILM